MSVQLEEMWDYTQDIADNEDGGPEPAPPDFKKITPEKIEKTFKEIERKIRKSQKHPPRPSPNAVYKKQL